MDELFIYDNNKGLFKEILKSSFVIEGRYHISSNQGQDLNSNNLDTLISTIPDQKYPLCVCIAPPSKFGFVNGQLKEDFYFTLLFLCQTYNGTNGTKQPDPKTRKSTHEVWYDWADMKRAAMNFISVLDDVTRKNKLSNGLPIVTQFNIDSSTVNVKRLSKFNEDRISGVSITFAANLMGSDCNIQDYPKTYLTDIVTPIEIVHAQHKH
jgi:hypothetical protein